MSKVSRDRTVPDAAPTGDDEEFCDTCFAGLLSTEHHQKCVLPERLAAEAACAECASWREAAWEGVDSIGDLVSTVDELRAERDRAREECGHEKAMRASQREEMMRYFNEWKAAETRMARVMGLVDRWESEAKDRGPDDMLYTSGVAAMIREALEGKS